MPSSPRQLLYADYCALVARREDFETPVVEALEYWICDYVARLREFLGHSDKPGELLDILVRNRRNSFYVASSHAKTPAGCAVFITPSFFNHHCRPNIFYHSWPTPHVPRVFEFCADAELPAGSELCITYLDDQAIGGSVERRRAQLRESFQFTCMCERCVADDQAATVPLPGSVAATDAASSSSPTTASAPAASSSSSSSSSSSTTAAPTETPLH